MTEAMQFLTERGFAVWDEGFYRGELYLKGGRASPSPHRCYLDNVEGQVESIVAAARIRDEYIARFGFSIPSDEAIAVCATFRPLLEVGAGSGYWSHELRKAGVDVIATDPGTGRYRFGNGDVAWLKPWVEIERITGGEAVAKYPGRNLLTCWPDMATWPAETLRAFTGKAVLYVGEGEGGCTADKGFHELLRRDYAEGGRVALPHFTGIHDDLEIWMRN